jgi:hypothetical protein
VDRGESRAPERRQGGSLAGKLPGAGRGGRGGEQVGDRIRAVPPVHRFTAKQSLRGEPIDSAGRVRTHLMPFSVEALVRVTVVRFPVVPAPVV